jgi:hypothetical protein
MQCILCKIIFGKFFTSTIILYAFLYALLFAQKNLFLQKVGVTASTNRDRWLRARPRQAPIHLTAILEFVLFFFYLNYVSWMCIR